MWENFQNDQLKQAFKVIPILEELYDSIQQSIECVLKTLKVNYDDMLNRFDFSDYVPERMKNQTTNEAFEYVKRTKELIESLREIKREMQKDAIHLPNAPLFDFVLDGGVFREVDDIYAFVAQYKTVQPIIEYRDSVKRYHESIKDFIRLIQDPEYFTMVKDNSTAKF